MWYNLDAGRNHFILFFSKSAMFSGFLEMTRWSQTTKQDSLESLVIKQLESLCAIFFRKYQFKRIYFSLESWVLNSSLCELGISLKCSCSVAWWLTDGPISCSRSESVTNLCIWQVPRKLRNRAGIWEQWHDLLCACPSGNEGGTSSQWNHRGVIDMKEEVTCLCELATFRTTSLGLKRGEKNLGTLGLLRQGQGHLKSRSKLPTDRHGNVSL